MAVALTLLSAMAWTVVYVGAIRIGFQQRTYARGGLALVPADRAAMGTFSTTGVETSRC
jgi:hypothetical protein